MLSYAVLHVFVLYPIKATVVQIKKLNGHQCVESVSLLGALISLLKQHIS